MTGKAPTIYDIAREAGVSIATVSRVMGGRENVSAKTRDKVEKVARRYAYQPSTIARSLEHHMERTIGIVVQDLRNPYYNRMLCAAEEEAQKYGYDVWLYRPPQGEDYSEDDIVDRLIARGLSGAFIAGGIVEASRADLPGAIHRLRQHMPVALICPPIHNLDCICLYYDLATAAAQVVRHLNMLGHRRIAFVGGAGLLQTSGARGEGFLAALRELGLEDVEKYRHEGGYNPEAGEIGVLKLLGGCEKKEWPTAIVCFNDMVALGALKQLKQMNLRVPQDMAVVGFDNDFFSAYTDPPLTTVDLHPDSQARSAINELMTTGAQTVAPFTLMRDATLIIRESCGVKLGRREFAE